jgi:hypothetical protein
MSDSDLNTLKTAVESLKTAVNEFSTKLYSQAGNPGEQSEGFGGYGPQPGGDDNTIDA